MSDASPAIGGDRGRDWQPWVILGVLAIVLIAILWLTHRGERPLSKRTVQSGIPLTPEQKSVDFAMSHPEINAIVNSMQILKGMNLQQSLRSAVIDSLRR